jgi:biopolymer transport protein ExbD
MRRRLRRRVGRHAPAEINITAFMNLMVILVPFLLITAVFSRITILQLNLPDTEAGAVQANRDFEPEVIVRDKAIVVGNRNGATLARIEATASGHDYARLSEILQQVKARFPDKLDATLLVEADIPYDILVQVMDSMRFVQVVQAGGIYNAELFPDISIGDAPDGNLRVASRQAGHRQ